MIQCQIAIDDRVFVLEVDEKQLQHRGVGDLITCEIRDVKTSVTKAHYHSEEDRESHGD